MTAEQILKAQMQNESDSFATFYKQDVLKAMEAYANQIKSESEATREGLFNRVIELQNDADTMFNALFAIISNEEINDLPKCMAVANEAINRHLYTALTQ